MIVSKKSFLQKMCLAVFIISVSIPLNGQSVEKEYYVDRDAWGKTKKKRKASYVAIINHIDTINSTYEFLRLEDNFLLEYRCFKKDVPCGIWKSYKEQEEAYVELDYTFEVAQSKSLLEEEIYFDFGKQEIVSEVNPEDKITPPIFGDGSNIYRQIYPMKHYPPRAREKGVEGVTKIHIKIDKEGKLRVLSYIHGKYPDLYMEAIRLLNQFQGWKPATLNGENIDVYSVATLKFKLPSD